MRQLLICFGGYPLFHFSHARLASIASHAVLACDRSRTLERGLPVLIPPGLCAHRSQFSTRTLWRHPAWSLRVPDAVAVAVAVAAAAAQRRRERPRRQQSMLRHRCHTG